MHLFQQHAVKDFAAAAAKIPVIDYGPYFAGEPGALHRLAEQVRTILALDPMSGHLFVFRSRSGERVKILWWDRDGYCIYYKRLERGTFVFPDSIGDQQTVSIDSAQLMKLLGGCVMQSRG